MPTGRLLAIIHPAHDDADQNASNDRSRQIVPQQQTPLSERHTAALLQWQPFAAILELSRCEVSPRDVARLIPNNVRGFSLSSNPSIDAAGVQAPATFASPGKPACQQFYGALQISAPGSTALFEAHSTVYDRSFFASHTNSFRLAE